MLDSWVCWPSPAPDQPLDTNFVHETAAPPKRRLEEPIFRIHGFAGQARRRSSAVLFTRPLRCRSGALREQFFEDSWLCWSSPVPDQPLGQQFYSRARCAAWAGALRELFSQMHGFAGQARRRSEFISDALTAPSWMLTPLRCRSGALKEPVCLQSPACRRTVSGHGPLRRPLC